MDPVHREHRRRVWWTLYLFDRLTSSKLGFPLAIQDHDIDVEPPSMDGLSAAEQEEFSDPIHLLQHVRLARITGSICEFLALTADVLTVLLAVQQRMPDERDRVFGVC